MKINTKMLITIGIICALFLVCMTYLQISHANLTSILTIAALFFLGISGLLYRYFTQRIATLNKQLNQVNEILDNHQLASHHLQQQLEKKSAELTKATATMEQIQIISEATTHPQKKAVTDNHQDTLTELPNRAFFNEALNKAMSHAKRHNKICAVLIIDIDAFKNINKTLGHDFGNEVLNKIGKRLAKTLRTEDLVARLDGDEFIVLLNDISKPKFASVVAEKLLQVCSKPIKDFFLTASIGISVYPSDGVSLEDMLKNADSALYKAKHAGGNKYQFHTHEMDIEAREFIKLESALRNAIDNNELVLYYQPKLHLKKGTIVGIEALLRWAHPELGILNPAQFIPIAEDTGLIMKIGEWALREACKTNKYWQNEGYEHLTIALNLSPKQFRHPEIAKIIETILKETELNPKYLELEINEATVMDNIQIAKDRLDNIKAIGVQLSMDHFGAGYTSISHLKQFPVSAIKIDQNYIKGIPNNPDDSAITNAFIGLAHHLGLEVVAEGVETAEQVRYLTIQDCDMVQGYFLSHPLPAQKIVLQLKKIMDRALF